MRYNTRQLAGVARKLAEAQRMKGRMGAQLVRVMSLLSEQCHTSALAVCCTQVKAIGSSASPSSSGSSVLSWSTPEQILSSPVSHSYLFPLFSYIFFPPHAIFSVFFTCLQFPDTSIFVLRECILPFLLPCNLFFESAGKCRSCKQLRHM